VVRAIALACDHGESGVFNITNPIKTSLNDLLEIFRKKYTFEAEYIQHNDNKLRDLLLSPKKSRELLGFESLQKNILID
jgi:nucleoside-diphosphate-sugar epimerase